jgi:hypothetical protein
VEVDMTYEFTEHQKKPLLRTALTAFVASTILSALGWWSLNYPMSHAILKGLPFGVFMAIVFRFVVQASGTTRWDRLLRILAAGAIYCILIALVDGYLAR